MKMILLNFPIPNITLKPRSTIHHVMAWLWKLALLYSVIVVFGKGIYLNEDQSEPTASSPSWGKGWWVDNFVVSLFFTIKRQMPIILSCSLVRGYWLLILLTSIWQSSILLIKPIKFCDKLSSTLSFVFLECLHCCHIYFHCSYL